MPNLIKFLASFIFPFTVEERKSEVSGKLEVQYASGKYRLDSTNVNYSFGGLHEVMQKAFSQFNIRNRNLKNALILGFGTGSVASILQNEYGKQVSLTGVEKDPVVLELGRKYFDLDQYKDLKLELMDVYDFVLNSSAVPYDLVIVDVFIDLLVPEKVREERFITVLNGFLSDRGILFFNFIARDDKTRDAGGKLYKLLSEKIGKAEWVRLFAKSTENWVFVCDKTKNPSR